MKTLIILTAIPGSGKSFFSKHFMKKHPNVHVVSSDEIRKELFGVYQCFNNEKLVWDTYLSRLQEHGKKDDKEDLYVIADATNPTDYFREFYRRETPMYDRHILVAFEKPFEECLKGNLKRSEDKQVPHHIMLRFKEEYQTPSDKTIALFDKFILLEKWFKSTDDLIFDLD